MYSFNNIENNRDKLEGRRLTPYGKSEMEYPLHIPDNTYNELRPEPVFRKTPTIEYNAPMTEYNQKRADNNMITPHPKQPTFNTVRQNYMWGKPFSYKDASENGSVAMITDLSAIDYRERLPRDIKAVLEAEHPIQKYLPILGAATGGLIGLKTHNSQTGSVLGLMIGGEAGSMTKDFLEHYEAKPYIDALRKQHHIKEARMSNEYIVEPFYRVNELGVEAPEELRAVTTYDHPLLTRLPLIGAGLGFAMFNKNRLMGAAIGGIGGSLYKDILFDKLEQPYIKNYVKNVKKKYNVE